MKIRRKQNIVSAIYYSNSSIKIKFFSVVLLTTSSMNEISSGYFVEKGTIYSTKLLVLLALLIKSNELNRKFDELREIIVDKEDKLYSWITKKDWRKRKYSLKIKNKKQRNWIIWLFNSWWNTRFKWDGNLYAWAISKK